MPRRTRKPITLQYIHNIMRQSNCSAPIPPGHSRGHHFFVVAPVCLSLYFLPCPALNHFNPVIFQCPAPFLLHFQCHALFYHTHFSSDLGAARGGNGVRAIWPAHNYPNKKNLTFIIVAIFVPKRFVVTFLWETVNVFTRVVFQFG